MIRYSIAALLITLLSTSNANTQTANNTPQTGKTAVMIVRCDGEVNEIMVQTIKDAIESARRYTDAILIFEMNTFGGRLDAAYSIVDLISAAGDIYTIAYVNSKAISAGALIALSCRKIYMHSNTTIGDCAPIAVRLAGAQMLGEKFQSPLRAKFRALAQQNGYPQRLAEAMVTKGPALYRFKTPEGMVYYDSTELGSISDSIKGTFAEKKLILKNDQLLTMTDAEAVAFGFATRSVNSIDEIIIDMKMANFFYAKPARKGLGLTAAWKQLSGFEKFYWYVAFPFTVLLIIMLVLTFLGFADIEFGDHHGGSFDTDHDASHFLAAFKLFTVRNFIIFFAMFGWTGIAMIRSGMGQAITLIVSFIVGLVMMCIISFLFYGISRVSNSGNLDLRNIVGSQGTVYIPIPPNSSGYGKVNVIIQGKKQELNAMTTGVRIETGSAVRVIKLVDKENLLVEKI